MMSEPSHSSLVEGNLLRNSRICMPALAMY